MNQSVENDMKSDASRYILLMLSTASFFTPINIR
jgi:hypothetical protein